jgi:5-methyltetrahydrofolate--homocysteine methyltransferase
MAKLAGGEIIVGDGAMGTMLQAAGHTNGSSPELWNVEMADVVRGIYRQYVEAGAQVIETNTFGGNAARLKLHDLSDRVYELNRAGAALAVESAHGAGVLVAGSIGPTGELIEPVGPLSMAEAQALFAEQIEGLVAGGVDLVLIETMSHINEVKAAVDAARQVKPDLLVAVTMSFDTNYHTMMGVSPREAVETIASWGVRIIGANCGNGPAEIEGVMTQMAQYRPEGVYLLAQSNAGMPRYDAGKIRYDGTPEVMADNALRLRNLGINWIGACCGSTPAHIAAMHDALVQAASEPIVGPPPVSDEGPIESESARAARSAERRAARRVGRDA